MFPFAYDVAGGIASPPDGRPAKYSANPVDKGGRAIPGVVVAWTVSPSDVGTVDVQGAFASLVPPGQSVRTVIVASVLNASGDRITDSLPVTVSATDHPPPDRDRDGTWDTQDSGPDAFGLAQFGGCPDSDSDGTPEPPDACPGVHGLTAFNGCPDADGDGIPEPPDTCPSQPAPGTTNGCPNPDADGDGILTPTDKCEGQREPRTADGCFRADLIVTSVHWSGSPQAGDCVQFLIDVKNQGSAASPNAKHGVLLTFDNAALMGYIGAVYEKFFHPGVGTPLAFGMLLLCVAVPLLVGLRWFRRKDF